MSEQSLAAAGVVMPPAALAFSQQFQGMFGTAQPPASLPSTVNPSPSKQPPHHTPTSTILPSHQSVSAAPMQPALPKEPAPEKKPIVKPPPEPKSEERKLPPHWRTAKDGDGKTYFYHALTRETQWDMPSGDDKSNKQLSETPASPTPKKQQYQAKKSKREEMIISPVKEKDSVQTSSFNLKPDIDPISKKSLADFKSQLAKIVVTNLSKYNKVDCSVGRIMDSNDFKFVARKLTHGLTEKELQRKSVTELGVTDSLKQRVKIYISSYMGKFGPIYHRT